MKPKPIGSAIYAFRSDPTLFLCVHACTTVFLCMCVLWRLHLCTCELAGLSFIHSLLQLQLSGGVYLIGALKGGNIHKLDEMI